MKPRRVLIIGDNLQDCLHYGASLPSARYDLAVCSSFDAGADLVEKEEFDFVIVDQGSEKFMARTVLERAAQFRPHTPVLVVASSLDLHCYLDALELGAIDYLERPEPEDIQWEMETRMRDASRPGQHGLAPLFTRPSSLANHASGKT
jgi:DNA-binding NtrC family response regulator